MEYSEPELILPALEILSETDGIPTAQLSVQLRQRLKPTGKNLELLKGRNDDRFSQYCRNLKSHDTLEKKGLAKFRDGRFYISNRGKDYIRENSAVFEAATKQGFAVGYRQKLARKEFRDALVEEGQVSNLPMRVYKRSRRLTEFARQSFADENGRIVCRGCGFEGTSKYGDAGLGLIEVHHLIPLYLREGKNEQTELEKAVQNVVPLCPTCHRLVHRDLERLISVQNLQNLTNYDPK